MPTLITLPSVHQDGSRERQLVHMPANQETSVRSSVASSLNETPAMDHAQGKSKDKTLPDQKRLGNGLYPQSSAFHTEQVAKNTTHRSAFPGVITAQKDQTWLSKSTNQVFNCIRRENVSREANRPRIEENTSSISTYCKATFGSVTSKETHTQNGETRTSKPEEDVHRHSGVDNKSSPTAKTPIAVKPNSTAVHCYPSFGSVTSKEIATRRNEVLVQNEAFPTLSSTSLTVPSISNDGIERERSESQRPKSSMKLQDAFGDKTNSTLHLLPPNKFKKPGVTKKIPRLIKDGFNNREDGLHDTPSKDASSMKVLLRVDDPVRPASDSGPFSIRRLLSSYRPSQKSQATNATSCVSPRQQCDLNKHKHPSGTPSRNSLSLNGAIVRNNNPVKPRSSTNSSIIQNMHISTESSQVTNTPNIRSSPQDYDQSSSTVLRTSSTSSSDFIAGRNNSNSLIAPLSVNSLGQDHFGMHGAPLQTTPSSISQRFYEHNRPSQNVGHSNECERKSQAHFHPSVIKIADKTAKKRKLPVATVQAMTNLSSPLHVGSSVPSRERLNTRRNHSKPPGNRSYSTEKTRSIQQWRHKDPKIQTRQKSYDVETLHLPRSTSSVLTSTNSENSDLQKFVSHLTEPEHPHEISVIKEQELETSLDIGREGQLLGLFSYHNSVNTQQVEILQKQSMRVWTIQSDENWVSDDPNRMGMNNAPNIHESVTDRDILPSYEDNVLQNRPYFTGCHSPDEKQHTPVGYTSSTAHPNLQNSLHLHHCPMRQMKQPQLSHHRK